MDRPCSDLRGPAPKPGRWSDPASRIPIWVRRPPPWRLSSIARSIWKDLKRNVVLPAVNEINQHGAEGDFFVSYEGVREGKAFIKIRFMLTKSAERDDRDMRLQGRARRGRAFAAIAGPGSGLAIGVAYQPTDAVLDQLRTIAPGWDRQALLARYREWSKGKARPDNPHGAFIGWARRFTPASRMPIWVRRPPPWRLSSIAR